MATAKQPLCGERWRKPAEKISDRAARYRSNSPECRPAGPKICSFCGNKKNVEPHHLDGEEKNNKPENLTWACRGCNVTVGNTMRKAGLGRLTHQFNPSTGAKSLGQWVTAVMSLKRESDAMSVRDAVQLVRATPAADRSKFARQIWQRRRRSGNPAELVIFGNPKKKKKNGHKLNCKCFACKAESKNPGGVRVFFDRTHNMHVAAYGNLRATGISQADARAALDEKLRNKQKNPKRATRVRRRTDRSRNPNAPSELRQAVKLFESFHGKEPQEIAEKHVSAAVRMDYAALGNLVAIGLGAPEQTGSRLVHGWEKENHISFHGDGVKLASSPDGKQLYAIGGNQNLTSVLPRFDLDANKDFIDLGEIGFVVYLARKIHGNYEPTDYVHQFGEKSGVLPKGMYDTLRKQIFFVGGEYWIKKDHGISPGIEN
jgi:hypothetical protein